MLGVARGDDGVVSRVVSRAAAAPRRLAVRSLCDVCASRDLGAGEGAAAREERTPLKKTSSGVRASRALITSCRLGGCRH
mmetsp:Transcript_22395/g.70169  ORF Transcript_22395/g.70169 Transcript_22395/m.70169 type:complete len:80 (+) Transcript_22395:126-365(+)